ncbi:hypothetical protein ACHAXT_006520 [Thalassiosira profunda]
MPSSKEEKVELTAEEAKQLETAFKDEDFRKLLADYAAEIADPKHKDEQEAYIARLEAEGGTPEGKALVWPSSGFVVKCTHTKKREGTAEESKLFLNFVHSPSVEEPKTTAVDATGVSWSVPHAIGPMRMETDKSGNLVPTFDCCFHPSSLTHAARRKEFLELVVDAAKDAVIQSFQAAGEDVEILSGHTILRGVAYKSGNKPKALLVAAPQDAKASESREEMVVNEAAPADTSKVQVLEEKTTPPNNGDTKPIIPTYTIVEQGAFDIAEHTTLTTNGESLRPKQLKVVVKVDRAESAADVYLDVSEMELLIKPGEKCVYELELSLPYPVDPSKGKASFKKKDKELTVTLPVV